MGPLKLRALLNESTAVSDRDTSTVQSRDLCRISTTKSIVNVGGVWHRWTGFRQLFAVHSNRRLIKQVFLLSQNIGESVGLGTVKWIAAVTNMK